MRKHKEIPCLHGTRSLVKERRKQRIKKVGVISPVVIPVRTKTENNYKIKKCLPVWRSGGMCVEQSCSHKPLNKMLGL